jgi:hypothetical protein
VLPGTGNVEAPIEERTERCATDAWWMIGRAMICTEHLRGVLSEDFETLTADVRLNESEQKPWNERHRYSQKEAQPDWKPSK